MKYFFLLMAVLGLSIMLSVSTITYHLSHIYMETRDEPKKMTMRDSHINNASDKIVVSFSLRKEQIGCIEKRVLELRQYAVRVGADFVFVDRLDHISLQEITCPEASPRFFKFWLIRHYLERYKQVLYLDESQRMTSCSPNLFLLPSNASHVLAAADKGDKRQAIEQACAHYGVKCSNNPMMVNSGLLLFNQRYHMEMFRHPPQCNKMIKVKGFEDQALFHVMFQAFNATVEDLNKRGKVVLQGSEVCTFMNNGDKINSSILHITRSCRAHLCTDFDNVTSCKAKKGRDI